MTTVAYLAVSPEGRTDRHCVLLGEESLPGLRRLTETVHEAGAAASGADRPCRAGGQRPVERCPFAGSVAPTEPERIGDPGSVRARTSPGSPGSTAGGPRSPSRPDSTASKSTSATTICSARS